MSDIKTKKTPAKLPATSLTRSAKEKNKATSPASGLLGPTKTARASTSQFDVAVPLHGRITLRVATEKTE